MVDETVTKPRLELATPERLEPEPVGARRAADRHQHLLGLEAVSPSASTIAPGAARLDRETFTPV